MQQCKKCLLLEAGERVTYDEIMRYVATLDKRDLVPDEVYSSRLGICQSCDNLLSGMCRKCGCYVEVRARLRDGECPDYDNKRW